LPRTWSPSHQRARSSVHLPRPWTSIHAAALAHYGDHKDEVDADIERRSRYAEQARQEVGSSSLAEKLRSSRVEMAFYLEENSKELAQRLYPPTRFRRAGWGAQARGAPRSRHAP
jgi:hypothetical protein